MPRPARSAKKVLWGILLVAVIIALASRTLLTHRIRPALAAAEADAAVVRGTSGSRARVSEAHSPAATAQLAPLRSEASCRWIPPAIPRVVFTTWATRDVSEGAATLLRDLRAAEPCFEHRLITTEQCVDFGNADPTLHHPPVADVPLPWMQVELCKLIILWRFGGVVRDVDATLSTSLEELVRAAALPRDHKNMLLLFAKDREETARGAPSAPPALDMGVLVASPQHRCVREMIMSVAAGLSSVTRSWQKMAADTFFLHRVFRDGPAAVAHKCRSGADGDNLVTVRKAAEVLRPGAAVAFWAGADEEYAPSASLDAFAASMLNSGADDRPDVALLDERGALRAFQQAHVQPADPTPAELLNPRLLAALGWSPTDTVIPPPDRMNLVNASINPPLYDSLQFNLGAAAAALDANFATAAFTGLPRGDHRASLEVTFGPRAPSSPVKCVRVLRPRFDALALSGIRIEARGTAPGGTDPVFLRSPVFDVLGFSIVWSIDDDKGINLTTVRVLRTRAGAPLRVAELQLFPTQGCVGTAAQTTIAMEYLMHIRATRIRDVDARAAQLQLPRQSLLLRAAVVSILSTTAQQCPTGVSFSSGLSRWTLCVPPPKGCSAVFIGASSATLFLELALAHLYGCAVTVVSVGGRELPPAASRYCAAENAPLFNAGERTSAEYERATEAGSVQCVIMRTVADAAASFAKPDPSIDVLYVGGLSTADTLSFLTAIVDAEAPGTIMQLVVKIGVDARNPKEHSATLLAFERLGWRAQLHIGVSLPAFSFGGGAVPSTSLPPHFIVSLATRSPVCAQSRPSSRTLSEIPSVVFSIVLGPQSTQTQEANIAEWRGTHPCFSHSIVRAEECAALAAPKGFELGHVFEMATQSSVRAEICKYLVIYHYGGIYRDPDTTPLLQNGPWLNQSQPLHFAASGDKGAVITWLFAAQPRHPCIAAILRGIERAIQGKLVHGRLRYGVDLSEAVSSATVTDALKAACPDAPQSSLPLIDSVAQIRRSLSTAQRDFIAAPHDAALSTNFSAASGDMSAVDVGQSVPAFRTVHQLFSDPLLALDANLETVVHVPPRSARDTPRWWVKHGGARIALASDTNSPHRGEPFLATIRLLPPRDRSLLLYNNPIRISLLHGSAIVLQSPPLVLSELFHPFVEWGVAQRERESGGERVLFDTIVVVGAAGRPLRIAELQLLDPTAAPIRWRIAGDLYARTYILPPDDGVGELAWLLTQPSAVCSHGQVFAATPGQPPSPPSLVLCRRVAEGAVVRISGAQTATPEPILSPAVSAFMEDVSASPQFELREILLRDTEGLAGSGVTSQSATLASLGDDATIVVTDVTVSSPDLITALASQRVPGAPHLVVELDLAHPANARNFTTLSAAIRLLRQRYFLTAAAVLLPPSRAATATEGQLPRLHRLTFISRAAFHEAHCVWASGRAIPPVMYSVWKSRRLFVEAAAIAREWELREPCIEQRLITDDDCQRLAAQVGEGFMRVFESVPVGVMRADMCRVAVVYLRGGAYRDLDVSWKRPLRAWLDMDRSVVVGNETAEGRLCNWFFAAAPMAPCMERFFEHVVRMLPNATAASVLAYMQSDPDAVFGISGPAAFTKALRPCATPLHTHEDMEFDSVVHNFGSQRWRGRREYASWVRLVARALGERFGDIFVSPLEQRYVFTGQARAALMRAGVSGPRPEYLAPPTDGIRRIVPVADVRVSGLLAPAFERDVSGPHLGIDGDLDTVTRATDPADKIGSTCRSWWAVTFAAPLLISAVGSRSAGRPEESLASDMPAFSAIRLFASREDSGFHDMHPLELSVFDDAGRVVATSPTPATPRLHVLEWQMPSEADGKQVLGVNITCARDQFGKHAGVRFAELQLVAADGATPHTLVLSTALRRRFASHPRGRRPECRAEGLAEQQQSAESSSKSSRQPGAEVGAHTRTLVAEAAAATTEVNARAVERFGLHRLPQQQVEEWRQLGSRLASAALTTTYRCLGGRPLGDFHEHDLWYTCDVAHLRRPCVAIFSSQTAISDLAPERVLAQQYGCRVVVLDHTNPQLVEGPLVFEGAVVRNVSVHRLGLASRRHGQRLTVRQLMQRFGAQHVSMLRIAEGGVEYDIAEELVQLAAEGRIDEVQFEAHFWGEAAESPGGTRRYAAVFERLHRAFLLVSVRKSLFTTTHHIPDAIPCCFKLAFVRKARAWALDKRQIASSCPLVPPAALNWGSPCGIVPAVMRFPALAPGVDTEAAIVAREWRLVEPCLSHRPLEWHECEAALLLMEGEVGAGGEGDAAVGHLEADALKKLRGLPTVVAEPLCIAAVMFAFGGLYRSRLTPARAPLVPRIEAWNRTVSLLLLGGGTTRVSRGKESSPSLAAENVVFAVTPHQIALASAFDRMLAAAMANSGRSHAAACELHASLHHMLATTLLEGADPPTGGIGRNITSA